MPRGSARDPRSRAGLPSYRDLVEFLRASPEAMTSREIARAFGLGPADGPALRGLLRAIERSGEVVRGPDRKFAAGGALPEIAHIERAGSDSDGFPLVRPVDWSGEGEAPRFRLTGSAGDELGHGERALARLTRADSGEVEAEIIRRVTRPEDGAKRVVGVFRRTRDGGVIAAADRRDKTEYRVLAQDAAGLPDGELVVAEEQPSRRLGSHARILERLGSASAPDAISRLTIAAFDIPAEFPAAALAEADSARSRTPAILADSGRTDFRDLALVTIDGEDARDFDDAVWAEPDSDPANRGGWHIVVAIADVAAYVGPGSALDGEAARRGNSVYFPDRVVPMLPEALSNDLCSLRPGEDRPCVAARLWIDSAGRKRRHRFERGVMRSAARLTYEAVQAARDGGGNFLPLAPERLDALYGAFAALDQARRARGALELDLAEHRVVLDEDGRPIAVVPRARLDSHRLIEEFMILANVAAAEELEARHQACMYRVHDAPDPEKLAALRDFLDEIGIPGWRWPRGRSSGRSCSTASWRAPPRHKSARSSTNSSCAARRRRCTARTISAISGLRCRATPISRRRFGAMPICSCIGRWSRAARRLARPAKLSVGSRSTSRRPSAAPRRPNAARSTAIALCCSAARSAPCSRRG